MLTALSLITGCILLLLAGVHMYWLTGGRKGSAAAIPSDGTKSLFQPSRLATGVVALLLAAAGLLIFVLGSIVPQALLPHWLIQSGGWLLAIVFVLRAIGDFRWVGFFKQRRNTQFAKYDTLLYSPLCLFLGLSIIIIVLA